MKFEKELNKILKRLIQKYKLEKVILFGSLNSNPNHANDIDLFIIKNNVPKLRRKRTFELDSLFLDREVAIDFIVYSSNEVEKALKLKSPVITDIINTGKVLYERNYA
ncbi:MAG: nucleotidyltransferase domain-containing protein [Spirochaetia bacterium]|nr:nucleotidyltransferase domain-containing protein [Spirochaetia bacterium]